MESLPKMWANNKNNGNCVRQAIDTATKIMNNVGGKIIIFQSNANIIKEVLIIYV